MYRVKLRSTNRIRRKLRVRKKIFGTSDMPRLSVFRSNKYIYGQIIDDSKGNTLADVFKEAVADVKPFDLGKVLAKKAVAKKIKRVVFDRNGYKYHGRVKEFCEGVREGGLQL